MGFDGVKVRRAEPAVLGSAMMLHPAEALRVLPCELSDWFG